MSDITIDIQPATLKEREILRSLMGLYLYDFSEFTGDNVDERGWFEYEYLDRYFSELNRYAFLVRADGKLAGFVLVMDLPGQKAGEVTHLMAEFFILKKYRRQKIGQKVAWRIFDHFPGSWRVSEITNNLPAQAFWRRIINTYTGGKYQEFVDPMENDIVQVFETGQK